MPTLDRLDGVPVPKPIHVRKEPKPMRRVNRKRRQERYIEDFGERGVAVREMPCLVVAAGDCEDAVEAAHAKSRGAGGDRRELVPLCGGHHEEQHWRGVKSFQAKYHVDLHAEADRIARELDARGLP